MTRETVYVDSYHSLLHRPYKPSLFTDVDLCGLYHTNSNHQMPLPHAHTKTNAFWQWLWHWSHYPSQEPHQFPYHTAFHFAALSEASYALQNHQTRGEETRAVMEEIKHFPGIDTTKLIAWEYGDPSAKKWEFGLFRSDDREHENEYFYTVAFRGTNGFDELVIDDVIHQLGEADHLHIVDEMGKKVIKWVKKYQIDIRKLSFTGHSEGGLYARYVLDEDEKYQNIYRVTFNAARAAMGDDVINLRTAEDPVTIITKKPLHQCFTIAAGGHSISNFTKEGVLFTKKEHFNWSKVLNVHFYNLY